MGFSLSPSFSLLKQLNECIYETKTARQIILLARGITDLPLVLNGLLKLYYYILYKKM